MIHLGDYFDDGQTIQEENSQIPMYQVPGNCDRYRCPVRAQEILVETIGGVRFYMTHGHLHGVKSGTYSLIRDAREAKVSVVLYGHTHCPDCRYENGLWILNPGSSGSYGGTAGLIRIEAGEIISCRIVDRSDLEELE